MSESLRKALHLFDALHGSDFKSARQLAEEIGTRPRTVQGYIGVFRDFDWPIESSHAKGYRVSGVGLGTQLTERELVLLAVLLAQGSSLLPSEDFEKLTYKLTELLTPSAQSKLEEIQGKLSVDGNSLRDLEVLTAVGRCFSDDRLQMVMDYKKTVDSDPVRRNVVPLRLRHQDGWYYVDVYDLDKQGTRSFRLDRFQKVQLLRQNHPIPRPAGGVEETHKWDFGDDDEQAVAIEVTPKLGAWLKEKPVHRSQVIQERDKTWVLTFKVKRLDMFVDWFMGLRGARVLDPPRLTEMVKERARSLIEDAGTLNIHWC